MKVKMILPALTEARAPFSADQILAVPAVGIGYPRRFLERNR